MTLLEYIQSLQDQNLSQEEIFAKAQEWKKNNPQPEVEEEVEETIEQAPVEESNVMFGTKTGGFGSKQFMLDAMNNVTTDFMGNRFVKVSKEEQINNVLSNFKVGSDERTAAYFQLGLKPDDTINKELFEQIKNQDNRTEKEILEDLNEGDIYNTGMPSVDFAAIGKALGNDQQAKEAVAVTFDNLNNVESYIEELKKAEEKGEFEVKVSENPLLDDSMKVAFQVIGAADNIAIGWENAYESSKAMGVDFLSPVLSKFIEEEKLDEYVINQFKKSSKLMSERNNIGSIIKDFDEEGNFQGFTQGTELIGGVINGVGSLIETMVPAALTRGASLLPQIAAPMYIDYNITKAESLYGENPNALRKLKENGETEILIPTALGGLAMSLEYIGLKGIAKQIAGKTGKISPFVNMLFTQSGEGITEVGQLGVETFNNSIAKGSSITESLVSSLESMSSQEAYESFALGFVSSGLVTAPSTFSKAMVTQGENVGKVEQYVNTLSKLQIERNSNKNPAFRQAKDVEITEVQNSFKDFIKNSYNLSSILDKKQQDEIVSLVDQKNKNNKNLENLTKSYNKGEMSSQQYGSAKGALVNSNKALNNKITRIQSDIQVKKEEISKAEKERAETVGMSILPTRKPSPKADELATQYQQDPSAVDVEALLDQYNKIGLAAIKFDTRKGDMAREDAIAEINKEFAGIMDRWSPDKGSFSTFVTANIAPKAQGIYDKYIGKRDVTTLDRPEAREVVAEEIDVDVTPTEVGRAKVYPASLEVITENVTPEVRSEQTTMIKDDINRAVATVSTSPKAVAKNIVDQIKTKEYRQLLKNKLGRWNTDQYNDNVDRLITKDFIATLPVAQLKRRFPRLFEIEVIDRVPTVKIEDGKRTDFKKPVYKIPAITDAKLETIKEYFKDNEKRHQSLMEVLGEGVAIEQMQELRGDQAFMTDLQGRLELKGSNLTAEQFLDEVEYNLDKRNLEDKSLDVLETEVVEEIKPKAKPKPKFNKSKIEKAAIQPGKRETRSKGIQEAVKQVDKAWVEMGKADKVIQFKKLAKKLYNKGLGKLLISTNLIQRADPAKAKAEQISISSLNRVLKNENISLERRNVIEKAIEANELIDLDALRKELGEEVKLNEDIKNAIRGKDRSPVKNLKSIEKLVNENLSKLNSINKGKKEIINSLKDIIKSNPELLPSIDYLIYQVNNSVGFARVLAPLVGYIDQVNYNQSQTVGEHALQYGQFTTLLEEMSLTLNNNDFDKFNNWLADNYIQIQAGDGRAASWSGSGRKTQDISYPQGHKDVFTSESLPALNLKQDLEVKLAEQIQEVRDGKRSWDEVGSSLLRYFNNYGYYNPNTFKVNGEIIAETEGVVVPKKYRETSKIDGQPIYPNVVQLQAYALNKKLSKEWTKKQAQKYVDNNLEIAVKGDEANLKIQEIAPELFQKKCASPCRVPKTSNQVKETLVNSGKVKANAQKVNKETKGLSAFDMDDTLALTKEKVKYTMPDGTTGELTAGEFAVEAENLTEEGAEFDFSNFENVDLSTPKGPLAGEALKKQAKYGSKDIYVVTARPGAAQQSIKTFLDSIGLNIPLENIITLEDGSPQAKADWVISKAEEGYNDFYFADDSALNVDTVQKILNQIDVKSKTQIAIADKAKRLNVEFNKQIEDVTGKEDFKKYSDARARLEGKQKDKGVFKRFINQFTITPSADDFMGLMYAFMGKGKQGNKHAQFIKENLMDPYNKAEQELLSAKVTVANDFAALKDAFPTLKSKNGKNPLMQEIGVGPYTKSQGIRVYMWNKQGMEIPGMSKRDINALVEAVENDLELLPFADNVMLVQKNKEYPAPTKNWLAGDITTDILRGLDTTYRKELMTEFNENSNIIFSPENLNKIEALYGNKFRESLVDSLRRMKSGSNRPVFVGSGARIVNEMMDWLNSSVGAVMFLNMRSGLLQLISNVNFINWGDNNVYNAAKAFTSKDYFPTVLKLMNSDYLVNRRDGLKINVNEAELADAGRQGGIKGMINYILDKGFAITRVMDSIAIATGGATFFINRKKSLQNRVNPETGKLYTEAQAESKAFDDFYAIAEETQQSSNPARISQQQASFAGRVILSFQNVTMQYNRKTKKSIQDLYNRRKKPGMTQRESDLSNLSSIIYYVGVQNLVFNGLQQALFALAFEDEPEEKEKANAASIANGMLDSLLFGLGFGGAIVSTVKNVAARVAEESEKKTTQYRDTVWNVFDISPVLDSKVRKLRTAAKTFDWNMDEIKRRGWSLDNPAYLAVSQIISATTNLPLDRVLRKAMNIGQAFDEETKTWQTVALLLGWSGWNVGLPYWGRESTIKKEEAEDEKLKDKFKNDVRKFKNMGFTKRIPLTGPNSGKPSGELGVDYIQIERPDGRIQYYKKP
jgi:hypothetical protein